MFMGARVVGPALAGLIIHTVGLAACFAFDGLSYVAVISGLAMMRPQDMHPQKRTTREKGHLLAGLRYVWRTGELRRPLVVLAIVCTFSFNWSVLVPLLAVQTFHGDAGTLGALSAMTGLGSLAAALYMANRAPKPTMRRLALFATGSGLALILAGLPPTLGLAYFFVVPMGLALMLMLITANSMLQHAAKPEARGRVMALYSIVLLGSTPIGAPISGWLAEHVGVRWAFAANGAVALVTGLVLLWHRHHAENLAEMPSVRDMPGETSAVA
jgi:MFS family permease